MNLVMLMRERSADILAEDDDAIGVTYSGFCQASLPHKKLPAEKEWIRRSERLPLMIEPGRLIRPGTNEGEFVGGPRARQGSGSQPPSPGCAARWL